MKKILISTIILINVLIPVENAHSGRTDSSGGHYDRSRGEYHYHHGYSAHQHINGLCPYEADLKDLLPSKCQSCGSNVDAENGTYCFDCGYQLIKLENMVFVVDGYPDKTRSEYFEEVQNLENKIINLEEKISEYENSLEEHGFRSIEEMNDNIKSLDTQIRNMWSGIFFGGLIAIFTAYSIGASNKSKT